MTTDYHYVRGLYYGQWDLNTGELSAAIETQFPDKIFSSRTDNTDVIFQFDEALTSAEIVILDQIVSDNRASFSPVPLAKEVKFAEIDLRTTELVQRGFEFPPGSGMVFSLSIPSQIKLLGIETLRNDPAMTYPIKFNTIDDVSSVSLLNATWVHNMTLVAFGTYRQYVDSGSALKDAVRACTTVDEVTAIVDPR